MGNPQYDRDKEAFIWRVPYPKPGYVCQIAHQLKMPLAGQKARYPIRKKNLRFTVPEDLPYEGEITVVVEESQKKHPRVRFTGKVLTPDGKAVGGARVLMRSVRTGKKAWAATSPAGTFVANVPEGRYSVQVHKPGYMDAESKCEASGGDKPQVFRLQPMSHLTVRVQTGEGKPVPDGVVLLAGQVNRESPETGSLRNGKAVFRSVKPGRYAVVYMDTPYDRVEFPGADVFHDAVSLKPGEKKRITLSPPASMRKVELRIDRDSGGVAADRPLALQLYRKSHGHSYVVYGRILGTKSSVDLTLPAGASYRPEFILGWTDKAIQKHGGDPLGIEDPDRYQDTVAYFGSRLKVPEKGVDGKRILELKIRKNTKHRTEH